MTTTVTIEGREYNVESNGLYSIEFVGSRYDEPWDYYECAEFLPSGTVRRNSDDDLPEYQIVDTETIVSGWNGDENYELGLDRKDAIFKIYFGTLEQVCNAIPNCSFVKECA